MLRQLCNVPQLKTIDDHVVIFPQPGLEVAETFNYKMIFVTYAVSTL